MIGTYINCGLAILILLAAITAIVSYKKPLSIVCSYNISSNPFKGDGEWKDSGPKYADDYIFI